MSPVPDGPLRTIVVVGGALTDGDRILVAKRPPGGSYGEHWEFPGGKVEPGETDAQALVRELQEELDITVSVGELIARAEQDYPRFRIDLRVYRCALVSGTPTAREALALRWVRLGGGVDETLGLPFPPADLPALNALRSAAGLPMRPPESPNRR